jgi:exonuclease SbcC
VILSRIELKDYKQFAGEHAFKPTERGVVGIIGPNGVGKTTLFESIEWCLYNPREIPNEEIYPRGRASRPLVKLYLEDPIEGVTFVIQRELLKSSIKAEIWREDQPETRIVHGSRPVTEYVTKTLLGLDHRAFVSTFFTRQKELTFFAGGATERRREVSRLLGFETIRDAQQLIAVDRQIAERDATSLSLQYQEQSEGRDFAEEIVARDAQISACAEAAAKATEQLAAASAELVAAREHVAKLQALEREDAKLLRDLERIAGDVREATAKRDSAMQTLANIEESEKARAALVPVAATEAEHQAAVEAHVREQERYRQLTNLQTRVASAQQRIAKDTARRDREVTGAVTPEAPAWVWRKSDANHPKDAANRLIDVGEGLDVTGARDRFQSLNRCLDRVRLRDAAKKHFRKFDDHLNNLEAQRLQIAKEDPKSKLEDAAKQREVVLLRIEQHRTNISGKAKTKDELSGIVSKLQARQFEGPCPTCGRPFSEHDAAITLVALEERIDQINAEIEQLRQREQQDRAEAAICDEVQRKAREQLDTLINLEGRVADGRPMVETARVELDKAVEECAKALNDCGLSEPPTQAEVDAAKAKADALAKIDSALGVVRQIRSSLTHASEEIAAAEREIAALGPVAYDGGAHESAENALAKARDATATIRQIDREIARRPQIEADRDTAISAIKRLAKEQQAVEKSRKALGFGPAALEHATEAEQAALHAERAARDARNEAQIAQKTAEAERKSLLDDQERIMGLALRAEERQREADELKRMYGEFSQFDQYVAMRVTPALADHASQLVAEVTEGKYDRIEFDEDYGIRVYDGDEHFPMEEFSGGERDVIALCARLALSRIVGGRARRPLSFLVLDEVFGSLDRDRRANLMSTLTQLSGTAEAFSQLFIISHVDDVRQAPDINEVWRISESVDGTSHLENLTDTGGVEEF